MKPSSTDILLITDIQYDFCTGGALAIPGGEQVVPAINKLSPLFPNVVLTQDWHPKGHISFASAHAGKKPLEEITTPYGKQTLWPDHCVQGGHGADFRKELNTAAAQLIIRKGFHKDMDSYSVFFENDKVTPTGLGGYLKERGIKRVFICGLALDYCVNFSAIDAIHLGYEVFVIEDACRAIDQNGSLAKAKVEMKKAGVKIILTQEIKGVL